MLAPPRFPLAIPKRIRDHEAMRPVIGVSCYGERAAWGAWDVEAVVLHRAYVIALESAGAAVVLVPPLTDESSIDAIVGRLDGIVIAGGADVNPADYGDVPHETSDRPRLDRDRTERRLYRVARDQGIPVLGICRGVQVMAVESGGKLIQDLPSAGYGQLHRERPGEFTEHGATFAVRPEVDAIRPDQKTPIDGLYLAGDWTHTGWPATMEGAVRSGYLAAEGILSDLGRPRRIVQPELSPGIFSRWLLGARSAFKPRFEATRQEAPTPVKK